MNNLLDSPYQPYIVASSEFDPTESKLMSFALLQNGWHYGSGMAFTEEAIRDSMRIHRQIFFKGFTSTDAFPGPNGEIQVTMYYENHYFQFEREASGYWNITHEKNNEEKQFLSDQEFGQVIDFINDLNPQDGLK